MPSLYALNLNFNPDNDDGTFESYNANGPTGRVWWKSTDGGGHWAAAGNPDTWAPSVVVGDQVQFAVAATVGASLAVQNVQLNVQFARDRHVANNPARIASPFQLAGLTPRCLLNDLPRHLPPWYYIGPYAIAISTNNPGQGVLKFEFSVVARVTFTNGTIKDFGYDPEMDVDI